MAYSPNSKVVQNTQDGPRPGSDTRRVPPPKYRGLKDEMVLSKVAQAMCDQNKGEDGIG